MVTVIDDLYSKDYMYSLYTDRSKNVDSVVCRPYVRT